MELERDDWLTKLRETRDRYFLGTVAHGRITELEVEISKLRFEVERQDQLWSEERRIFEDQLNRVVTGEKAEIETSDILKEIDVIEENTRKAKAGDSGLGKTGMSSLSVTPGSEHTAELLAREQVLKSEVVMWQRKAKGIFLFKGHETCILAFFQRERKVKSLLAM